MNKILVILPNNLGDVIMALPVLEGLKNKDPEVHITFFVETGYEGGLVGTPWCDRIFLFDRKAIRDGARTRNWRGSLDALKTIVEELVRERFRRIINLSQHPYAAYIAGLLSCPQTQGRVFLREGNHAVPDAWSRYLYAIPFGRAYNGLHATDIYRKIAGTADIPVRTPLTVGENEREEAGRFLQSRGIDPAGPPLMVLQPGAAYQAKRWPIEHFAALGRMLLDRGGTIVITGAAAETDSANSLQSLLNGAVVTAGVLSFRETIALLPHASGCVTGDTAIMHATAALGRPVYALFGPTNPVETGPYCPGAWVFSGRCPNRPCFCFECKTRLCMKSITPGDVYRAIREESPANATSDVYRTVVDADGVIRLDPLVEQGRPYYLPAGAALTRRFVDKDYAPEAPPSDGDIEALKNETMIVADAARTMAQSLTEFESTRSPDALRDYEKIRANLSSLSGVGVFWTALLNLRLNGVPLLDPAKGIAESRDLCREMADALTSALSIYP
jgi:heptosyltransferase-1/heptosyltransferase-2